MAYTRTPEQNTYQTIPIKFDNTATYRSGDLSIQRDSNIVNLFYDRISQENKTRDVTLKKRPGSRATAYNLSKSSANDALRGSYYDASSNRMYWAVNDKVYSVTPDSGVTIRTVATLATSSGFVGFCEFLQTSTQKRFVVFSDGTELWVDDWAAVTCTKVTDVDLPSPHVPQPQAIDGYLVVAKTDTGDLYNSDPDDPFAWTPGDYITAEMAGDYITMVATNRNYIVTFGTSTIEIFWDAGNVSGSPFSRNESGYRNVGYVTGLKQISNILYFVGQDANSNVAVYRLDGFDLKQISDPVVERSLQNITSTDNVDSQLYLNRAGYSMSVDGHTFYILVTPQTTWALDVREGIWYEWKGSDGTGLKIEATWGMFNGAQYAAIAGQSYISLFAPNLYQDFGSDFSCSYTTERFNADSQNNKTCGRITVLCDQYQSSGTSNLTLTWSDDDWVSTSGTRSINLFSNPPRAWQFGQFRTRSFRVSYADNYPLRIRGLELEINIGAN